eukprot:g1514.t1
MKSIVSAEEQRSGTSRGTPIRPRLPLTAFPPLQNDLLLRAAKGEKVKRAPVWMMRQAGRYLPEYMALRVMSDFFAVCRTPELACTVSLQPLERFKTLDAVIIFSDILVVPQAMGMECQMVKGKGPVFPLPIDSPHDLDRLNLKPDVEKTLGYVFDAINLTRERIAGRVPLIGFCGGPWTLMAYMIEGGGSRTFAKSKGWLYRHPEAAMTLLDALTESLTEYLIAQYNAGAQLLQVFESWGGELPQHLFRTFVLPRLKRIAEGVKAKCPNVPMTIFGRNLGYAIGDFAISMYDCVGLDWQSDPREARKVIELSNSRTSLQGNLDPCALYGTRESLRREVRRMLEEFGPQSHIANLGHGMQPTHDPEMAGYFIECVQEISTELYLKEEENKP